MNPHCRIGRVRMKNGGADVRVLERKGLNPLGPAILRHADMFARNPGFGNIVGYYIVGWTAVGKTSTCWETLDGKDQMPASRMPSLIEEVARRDLVTASEVRNIIDNEYVTPNSKPPKGA
jgi:hypothetical protein